MKKIIIKPISTNRISKRRYAPRICKKPDCKIAFTPTDARQFYCERQHRIDNNNDLRNVKNEHDRIFAKSIKINFKVLDKIFKSPFYIKNNSVHFSLLDYEK